MQERIEQLTSKGKDKFNPQKIKCVGDTQKCSEVEGILRTITIPNSTYNKRIKMSFIYVMDYI